MAVTKWLDPDNWTLAEWEDATLTVIVDALWSTLKGASDERQAFFEQAHSGTFDTDNEFPTLEIFRSGASDPNNAEKILAAVYPYFYSGGSAQAGAVEAASIKADGTAVTAATRAVILDLGELLQDVLSYTDDELLHIIDTDTGAVGQSGYGKATGKLRMAWVKQWYQVMNYPVYYNVPLGHLAGESGFIGFWDFFEEIQYIETYKIQVKYGFPTDASLAATVTAELTEPLSGSTPVDIYTTGDLDDSTAGVYSTNQEILDYAAAEFAEHYDDPTWTTLPDPNDLTGVQFLVRGQMTSSINASSGLTEQTFTLLQNRRVRFKIKDSFRALSPNKFTSLIYHYFYMTHTVGTDKYYNAFGSGINENETELKNLTVAGDGYYYLSIEDPDFSTVTVPSRPTSGTVVNFREEANQIFTLIDDATLGTDHHSILVKPNLADGTAFEYYTP
jgi:hypothetical protein